MPLVPLLALALCVSLAAPARALTVTLDPGTRNSQLMAIVSLIDPLYVARGVTPSAIPEAGGGSTLDLAPQLQGLFEAGIRYELSHTGFDFAFDTLRMDANEAQVRVEGTLYFSVDQDVDYVLAGHYEWNDPRGLYKALYADLTDRTTDTKLYGVLLSSRAPESWLDLEWGGVVRTGSLLAGHEYRLSFAAVDYARYLTPPPPDPQGVLSIGNGTFGLLFVPEPPCGAFGLVLLVALGLLRVRAASPRPPRGR